MVKTCPRSPAKLSLYKLVIHRIDVFGVISKINTHDSNAASAKNKEKKYLLRVLIVLGFNRFE